MRTLPLLCLLLAVIPAHAARISAGGNNVYAVDNNGNVLVWGANLYGQVCDGTTNHRYTPATIPNLSAASSVAAGGSHGLALVGGSLLAWGLNSSDSSGRGSGQLGDGSTVNRSTPTAVLGLSGVAQISAGSYHSLALKSDGAVWGWGYNPNGQVGDGSNTNRSSPVQLAISSVSAVAAGCEHSLALKIDGTVWAWGYNSTGQLGDGSSTNRSSPVQVSGLSGVTAIAAGCAHSLALKTDGTVWAWGFNLDGELGTTTTAIMQRTPLQVGTLEGIRAIAAGGYHSLALKSDGTVWTWGKNDKGQLGDGSSSNRTAPKALALAAVAEISAGFDFSVALQQDATVWAWGNNQYGQLGSGNTSNTNSPAQVKNSAGDGNLSLQPASGNDADRIFNYAEAMFPAYFAPKTSSQAVSGYTARIYATGNILGAKDGFIYVYGPSFNNALINVGTVDKYLQDAANAGF